MKKIKLTQGKVSLVDDCDYEFLNQWKWYAQKHRNTFYARRNICKDGKWTKIYMHQVLADRLGFKHGADHIKRNGLNNQRHNLRDATCKQQNENRGLFKNNKSGHTGVSWYKQTSKWWARIKHNGKDKHLGYFSNIEDAIKSREDAERKYFTHASS